MESMTTAIVRVPGAMREMTSLISSVWMRKPVKADGFERRAWALAER
jgi:hypothetical protein